MPRIHKTWTVEYAEELVRDCESGIRVRSIIAFLYVVQIVRFLSHHHYIRDITRTDLEDTFTQCNWEIPDWNSLAATDENRLINLKCWYLALKIQGVLFQIIVMKWI